MTLLERQQHLARTLSVIEDAQERLAAVVDRVRKVPPFPDTDRTEQNRVQGCVSRVWLVAAIEGERCRFRVDADSTLVRGLAALVCEVCDDALPAEIVRHESNILDLLHLTDQLSPTRRHGLAQVDRTIREFASRQLAAP